LVGVPGPAEAALRRRLVERGASLSPKRPSGIWEAWLNRVLQSREQAQRARDEILACGLLPHKDVPKNWDLLVALGIVTSRLPRTARILEAGATSYAPLLPSLYLYGYRALAGIDLVYEGPATVGPIRYAAMDLTRTSFPAGSFDAIACLSVIEHGVDLDAYVAEVVRLLRPGGLLVTSTDFWCEPIDTGGQVAFGVPIRIFTPTDIEAFVERARRAGLAPLAPIDLTCRDRAVYWERFGLRYTFLNLVLERR
jgi:SAM-dependent methyltransferase